jgi:hypothetical protein
MINLTRFFKETLILIILTLTAYAIHFTLVKDNIYNSKNILTSIYFFNFLLVLLLLIFFKISSIVLNFNHLSLFIILTIVKIFITILFFFKIDEYVEVKNNLKLVLNFFPVYFLFLILEIIYLRKELGKL